MNKLPSIRSRVSIPNGDRVNSTWTQMPTGFRLMSEYYSNQVYEICFSINDEPSLVSKQFYVMVENQDYSLRHLNLDVASSSDNPQTYEIYQYVAT